MKKYNIILHGFWATLILCFGYSTSSAQSHQSNFADPLESNFIHSSQNVSEREKAMAEYNMAKNNWYKLNSPNSEEGPFWTEPSLTENGAVNCLTTRSGLGWVQGPTTDDGNVGPIALGFNFNLYGTIYTSCFISANGYLTFVTGEGDFSPEDLPSTNKQNMVAPFWDDINVAVGCGSIWYKLESDHLIVKWEDVTHFGGGYSCLNPLNSFEVVIGVKGNSLTGPGKNVAFFYGDMSWFSTKGIVGVNGNNGASGFQYGDFSTSGSAYDGGYGLQDGIDHLDNKCLYFDVTTNACPPININFSASGLKSFWAPASDPYTFYYGLVDAKRIDATVTGGVGPFSYTWSTGSGSLMSQPGYLANTIQLYRPTAATYVRVDVTDQGSNCTYADSVLINWDGSYFCGLTGTTWNVVICQNGQTQCVPWTVARTALSAIPPTATLGACINPPKTNSVNQVSGLNVYPNPSSGLFTLEMPVVGHANGTVEVVNQNGQRVYVEEVRIEEGVFYHTFDLSNLPNGLYFVRVANESNIAQERVQLLR